MKLRSDSFADGAAIPGEFAFCIADEKTHARLGGNRNPHLAWDDVPAQTQSFVLICHDPDVPAVADDVNVEGRTIPASLPRVDFTHWLLIDLPARRREIAAGEFSGTIVARGKPGPTSLDGSRQGLNDYTGWFAGDADMRGDYYGYDGPCPPWNDSIVHRYVFTLFALDTARLIVHGRFTVAEVRAAMSGHVLAAASITGCYSLNPAVAASGR
jgi:Raf kinase inhibitor-like YbhB/YbcL family protein